MKFKCKKVCCHLVWWMREVGNYMSQRKSKCFSEASPIHWIFYHSCGLACGIFYSLTRIYFMHSLRARRNTHYKAWSYKKKEEKDASHIAKLIRKNSWKKVSVNSRIRPIYIIGQRVWIWKGSKDLQAKNSGVHVWKKIIFT